MQQDYVLELVDRKWIIRDGHGVHPVTISFEQNGWGIRSVVTDGPARASINLDVRIRRVDYRLWLDYLESDEDDQRIDIQDVCIGSGIEKPVSVLRIPSGHPAIKFFQKTRGDKTIAIDMDFDAPKYGTGEDAQTP